MNTLTERILKVTFARRSTLVAAALLAMAPAVVLAQDKAATPAADASKDLAAEMAKAGPRGDIALGKADAPLTVYEYASMTCSHCANFHTTVLPKLKEKYIDTGKVRLVMREFPLDNLAAAASMLVRCAGGEKSHELMSVFFKKQSEWAFVEGNPVPGLFKIAGEHGFTKESFDKCLTDQKLLDDITNARDKAGKEYKVSSTPTFFVAGKKLDVRSDQLESFDKAFEPLLKKP